MDTNEPKIMIDPRVLSEVRLVLLIENKSFSSKFQQVLLTAEQYQPIVDMFKRVIGLPSDGIVKNPVVIPKGKEEYKLYSEIQSSYTKQQIDKMM